MLNPALDLGTGERCKLPSGVLGDAQFWYISGSSGELSRRPAMQNCVYVGLEAYDLMNFNAHIIQLNYAYKDF